MYNLLFKEINWSVFGWSVLVMFGLALLFAVLIVVISKFFEVKKDTRIDEIMEYLPKANCGGCGYPGCEGFAKALLEGKADINDCGQTSKTAKVEISNILGLAISGGEETKIVVGCVGGVQCEDKYDYQGYGSCISQELLAGGKKACDVGCMGMGSCVDACPNFAIEVDKGVGVVHQDVCTACGLCARICPKKLIKRIPKSAKLYVGCSSLCRGKDVSAVCKAGCISCGICERICPQKAIHLENNVPVIDYSKCIHCFKCLEKCPRKVIRKID